MKKLILLLLFAGFFTGCVTVGGGTTTTGQSNTSSSPEAQAKDLTTRMKRILELSKDQEDKVLSVNIVYQKLIHRARLNNEDGVATSSKESYHRELKDILTTDQFSKFLTSFPEL